MVSIQARDDVRTLSYLREYDLLLTKNGFHKQSTPERSKGVAAKEQDFTDVVSMRGDLRARVVPNMNVENKTSYVKSHIDYAPVVLIEKKAPRTSLFQKVAEIIKNSKEKDLKTAVREYRETHLNAGWVVVAKASTPVELEKALSALPARAAYKKAAPAPAPV